MRPLSREFKTLQRGYCLYKRRPVGHEVAFSLITNIFFYQHHQHNTNMEFLRFIFGLVLTLFLFDTSFSQPAEPSLPPAAMSPLPAAEVAAAEIIAEEAVSQATTDPTTGCGIDLCFAMDFSESVSSTDFALEKEFVVNIVEQIEANLGLGQTAKYSSLRFSTAVTIDSTLTGDAGAFNSTISGLSVATSGGTNMAEAIEQCGMLLTFELTRPKVLILVTDGVAQNPKRTLQEALVIKPSVRILAVAVGSTPNTDFLKQLTMDDTLVKTAEDFADLANVVSDVAEEVCLDPGLPDSPTPSPELEECEEAEAYCEFTFEDIDGIPTFPLGATVPDKAFTPEIVAKDPSVFITGLNSNNVEAEFIENDAVILISKVIPPPAQAFSPTQFKPFTPSTTKNGTGLGHETFQNEQAMFAKNRCVRVYFSEWQILDAPAPEGKNIGNANSKVDKSENYCVVFRTA